MVEIFMKENYPQLHWELIYVERGNELYGRSGSWGPQYHQQFREQDYAHDEELTPEMSHLQSLYDESG